MENVPFHPLISRMMTNGEPIDSARIIEGFVGPAGQDENIRIYFDLTFTSYFEIAKVDVLHVESSNADDDDESKPTKIWIKKSARLEIVTIHRVSTEAAFLHGSLTNRLRPFQLPVGLQPLPPNTATGCTEAGCGSSLDICGTAYETGCYFPSDRGCGASVYNCPNPPNRCPWFAPFTGGGPFDP